MYMYLTNVIATRLTADQRQRPCLLRSRHITPRTGLPAEPAYLSTATHAAGAFGQNLVAPQGVTPPSISEVLFEPTLRSD
ncbi:uncharacterized protein N7529_001408 [Penicillium soppii]|uniref:uncharacterized protein n=1 Tax=Penicillium soppii TaxID=69789 RepID=UPI002547FDCE|nr:uncharacterized protein N7529_001408 [Penicillium soppii]KAJ5875824.1 hypothetical protein N7529_001408 [Penicillium soppii]